MRIIKAIMLAAGLTFLSVPADAHPEAAFVCAKYSELIQGLVDDHDYQLVISGETQDFPRDLDEHEPRRLEVWVSVTEGTYGIFYYEEFRDLLCILDEGEGLTFHGPEDTPEPTNSNSTNGDPT